jgi:hypothetical protein
MARPPTPRMHLLETDTDPSASADLAPLVALRDLARCLPFPPMPLMVLRGADAADAMASSFDLLKQEIILQRVTGTHRSQEQIVQDKTSRLRTLQEEMHHHCSSGAAPDSSVGRGCLLYLLQTISLVLRRKLPDVFS